MISHIIFSAQQAMKIACVSKLNLKKTRRLSFVLEAFFRVFCFGLLPNTMFQGDVPNLVKIAVISGGLFLFG